MLTELRRFASHARLARPWQALLVRWRAARIMAKIATALALT